MQLLAAASQSYFGRPCIDSGRCRLGCRNSRRRFVFSKSPAVQWRWALTRTRTLYKETYAPAPPENKSGAPRVLSNLHNTCKLAPMVSGQTWPRQKYSSKAVIRVQARGRLAAWTQPSLRPVLAARVHAVIGRPLIVLHLSHQTRRQVDPAVRGGLDAQHSTLRQGNYCLRIARACTDVEHRASGPGHPFPVYCRMHSRNTHASLPLDESRQVRGGGQQFFLQRIGQCLGKGSR